MISTGFLQFVILMVFSQIPLVILMVVNTPAKAADFLEDISSFFLMISPSVADGILLT